MRKKLNNIIIIFVGKIFVTKNYPILMKPKLVYRPIFLVSKTRFSFNRGFNVGWGPDIDVVFSRNDRSAMEMTSLSFRVHRFCHSVEVNPWP